MSGDEIKGPREQLGGKLRAPRGKPADDVPKVAGRQCRASGWRVAGALRHHP
jgi:hypothetical protein